MTDENIELLYALLCDDIRREDNGKLLIIGLYDSDILLPTLPSTLSLTLLTRLRIAKPEKTAIEFECSVNGNRMAAGKAEIIFHTSGFALVPFQKIPVEIKDTGQLAFRMKPAEQRWISLWEGKVALIPADPTLTVFSNDAAPRP